MCLNSPPRFHIFLLQVWSKKFCWKFFFHNRIIRKKEIRRAYKNPEKDDNITYNQNFLLFTSKTTTKIQKFLLKKITKNNPLQSPYLI